LCDVEAAKGSPGAAQAGAGMRAVLSRAQESFSFDYPVPLPDGERWYVMRVSPLRTETSGVIVHHYDITDRKRYEQQLTRQALRDPLTGLANRALLADRLDGALRRTRSGSPAVGILLLDLDRFSVVNDGLGYEAGDAVLVAVSARLRELVRPGDTVARLAADEFVVLCEGLQGAQELGALAGRLVAAFADPLPATTDSEPITVTTSIGIALGERDASGDTMLRQADAAMHHAKDHGRSRFEFFDKRVHDRALTRLGIEAELRRAVDNGEFRVVYQPIVDLASGDIDGVEALVRWEHPTRGFLLPEEFVAVAEDAGLLVPIGDWVLREACRQVRRWQDSPFAVDTFRVCVNVAAQQMVSSFADDVGAAIREAGIDARHLMLELTETAVMDVQVTRTASALHDMGVGFAIDDFGTGFSSMSYLKRFPVDVVKIDRSFIFGLGDDLDDTTIVGAIVNMAHTLGLITVAEGIEGNCQRDALLSLGCDRGQGFLFGEAAGADVIDELLATQPSTALAAASEAARTAR
jgi:diguanylate cyclase (GGDEF)-like protein